MTAKKTAITSNKITLPYQWAARNHQIPLWNYMMEDSGRDKRAVAVWHRRAGKDSAAINLVATLAHQRVGLYYYMAPSQKHARKIIWDNIGEDGRRVVDQAMPKSIRESTNDQEMRIVLKCGSIFQVLGSDNYDSIVGSNPVGIVFSEWAIADKPQSWDYMRPILAQNHGFAIFIYTPRGLNHGYQTYRMALNNPKWYCERLTIDNTGVLSPEQIEEEREAGMSEVKIQQEFYCAFHQDTERQIFNSTLVNEAMKREPRTLDSGAACVVGVDCARFGDDRSVIATRIGRDFKSIPLTVIEGRTGTLDLAYAIQRHSNKYQPDAIFLDSTGVGGGVYDACRELRIPNVVGINFQNSALDKDKYANIRAEMYQRFADWFDDPDTTFHDSNDLLEQLSCIQYDEDFDPHGRFKLQKKAKIKKETGISPDEADACALTFSRMVMRRDVRKHLDRSGRRKRANTEDNWGW